MEMIINLSRPVPYQECLIPNLPEEIQHMVRDGTNHVVIPLNIVVAIMSFVCNVLVIWTVTRARSLQRPPLLMLCSLAITDLLYAPYSIFRFIEILAHEHTCPGEVSSEKGALSALCLLATLGNLAIISGDRYLAVTKPWGYRANVTKSRTMKMICATWLLSVAITVLLYLSEKFAGRFLPIGQITSLVFYIVCTTVITTSYLRIFCKKTPAEEVFHIRAILEREKRTANTVGLILLVLLVTFLPGVLCGLILYVNNVNAKPFRPFYGFLYALNGFLNPLLNFGRNKEMRRALRNLINCFQRVQPSLAAPAPPTRATATTTTAVYLPHWVDLRRLVNFDPTNEFVSTMTCWKQHCFKKWWWWWWWRWR